jgi:hypothetical protein
MEVPLSCVCYHQYWLETAIDQAEVYIFDDEMDFDVSMMFNNIPGMGAQ